MPAGFERGARSRAAHDSPASSPRSPRDGRVAGEDEVASDDASPRDARTTMSPRRGSDGEIAFTLVETPRLRVSWSPSCSPRAAAHGSAASSAYVVVPPSDVDTTIRWDDDLRDLDVVAATRPPRDGAQQAAWSDRPVQVEPSRAGRARGPQRHRGGAPPKVMC